MISDIAPAALMRFLFAPLLSRLIKHFFHRTQRGGWFSFCKHRANEIYNPWRLNAQKINESLDRFMERGQKIYLTNGAKVCLMKY